MGAFYETVAPFFAVAVYLYIRFLRTGNRIPMFVGSLFMGLEMGLSLNARPLDGLWGGAIALFAFFYSLKKKRI